MRQLSGLMLLVCASMGLWTLGAQGTVKSIPLKTITVKLRVFPQNYDLIHAGKVLNPVTSSQSWKSFTVPVDGSALVLRSPGYVDLELANTQTSGFSRELKLEKQPSNLALLAELPSGRQPKSIVFSPDGSKAFVALLDGSGVDVYQTNPPQKLPSIVFPPAIAKHHGFVEIAILPWRDELWVSQMTTDQVHVVSLSTLSYRQSLPTGGNWPKVIVAHPYRDLVYVSNWVGESVAVFDAVQKKRMALWKTSGTPRGMAFSPDGLKLYVAIFGTGNIDVFRVSDGKRLKTMVLGFGAKRHLVVDDQTMRMFATDMELGEVWVFDLWKDAVIKRIKVGPKLNTCELSADGNYLFVSSRGTNNPVTYLEKGPDFGTMSVIDTRRLEKIEWVWGRNQPTGLSVHPELPVVAFTDFLDQNIEFYDFSALYRQ